MPNHPPLKSPAHPCPGFQFRPPLFFFRAVFSHFFLVRLFLLQFPPPLPHGPEDRQEVPPPPIFLSPDKESEKKPKGQGVFSWWGFPSVNMFHGLSLSLAPH